MQTLRIERKTFQMGRHSFELYYSPDLFVPNKTTEQFTDAVKIPENGAVIDMGSGVGPLAIWAALEQPTATIHAVEIVPEQHELLMKNISHNNLIGRVDPYLGSLFSPLPQTLRAEAIMVDVSGIADIPARAFGWYPKGIPTGGSDGAEITTSAVQEGKRYLAPNGVLYFPVGVGVSNDKRIIDAARKNFGKLELVLNKKLPLTAAQVESLDRELNGVIPSYLNIERRKVPSPERAATWTLQIYKATEPIN